jgi:hypothetical protein
MGTDKARHWAIVPFSGSAVAASKTSEKQKRTGPETRADALGEVLFLFLVAAGLF